MTTKVTKKPYTPPKVTSVSKRAIVEAAKMLASRDPQVADELRSYSPYAVSNATSLGRIYPTDEDIRSDFQRDVHRNLYADALLLLADKTQVFTERKNPFITNRLFHTFKVVGVSRTISRALGLNEDLTEAIAWGHDFGHTPFGHTGEEASEKALGKPFKHNLHSVRILHVLEKKNLMREVLDGIARHCGEKLQRRLVPSKKPFDINNPSDEGFPCTLEGCVVRISDIITYLIHDYMDALISKTVKEEDLPDIVKEVFGTNPHDMLGVMVTDVVEASRGKNYITMSDRAWEAMQAFFDFEYKKIIESETVKSARAKIPEIIETLYLYFTEVKKMSPQKAIDKIAGLTESKAKKTYNRIKGINEMEQLKDAERRSRLLSKLHDTLDEATDISELYNKLMDDLPGQFKSASTISCSIMLFEEKKDALIIVGSGGSRKARVDKQTIELDEGIAGKVFTTGESILIEDTTDLGTPGSLISVRIEAEGKALGVLNIRSEKPHSLNAEDREHLKKIAGALPRKIARTREGVLDGLTGLCNRNKGEARLKKLVKQAKEQNLPLSLIVFDIDHFKDTNDTYGHTAGDKVLKAIAQITRKLLKEIKSKTVGVRWGGEEFALGFLGMDIKETKKIAIELRKRIADEKFDIGGGETINKTVSLGVAELEPDLDFERLFKNADSAMYKAKKAGRNKVRVYGKQRSTS